MNFFIVILICGFPIIFSTLRAKKMAKHKDKYSLQERYDNTRKIAMKVLKYLRVNINEYGTEIMKEEHDQGRVYFANHLSVVDILVVIAMSPKPLVFISKLENLKTPFLKTHIAALDVLSIDRSNLRQSLKICKEAGLMAKNNHNDIMVFPEGTRSKDGEVHEFHAALDSIVHFGEVESVMICLNNTEEPLKYHIIKYPKSYVDIKVLEPIPYEVYKEKRSEFSVYARNLIKNELAELRSKDK